MAKVKSGPKTAGSGDTRGSNNSKRVTDNRLNVIFYLLLPLLFLVPFFRGLFFYEELIIAHMVTAILAGVYFYLNRERIRFSKSILDYAVIGMVAAYFLSSFVALNARDGVGYLMKYFNYFLIYLLVSQLVRNIGQIRKVLEVFFVSGLIVAIAGMGSYYGTFDLAGAMTDGLISSTLQYHNAAAIFMFAVGMIGLILPYMYQDRFLRAAIAGSGYIIILTAIGAGSRGALMVTPIAMLIQFIGLPRAAREQYFYTLLAVTISLVITAKSALIFDGSSHWGMFWLGFFLTCLIQYGLDNFALLSGKVKKTYLLTAGAVAAVALIAVLTVKGSEILPTSVVDRLQGFHLQNHSVMDRFSFYEDAVKIVKDHPVLGVGGGGWKSIYRSYQSYWYDTTEVHSHFFQVWVESGTIGFAFFLLLWLGLLVSGLRILRRSESSEMKVLTWTAFSAALAVGMHSAIDFTLSLGALCFFLWSIAGLVKSGEQQTFGQDDSYFFNLILDSRIRKIAGLIITVVFFAASASFYIAGLNSDKAIDSYNAGNIDGAITAMKTATTFDPFSTKNFIDLSTIYTQKASSGDTAAITYALQEARKAVEKDPGNSELRWHLARAYYNTRDLEQGVLTAEEAVNRAPFITKQYAELALYYNAVAEVYLQMNDKDNARILIEKTLALPERMKAQAAKLDKEGRELFKGQPLDEVDENLQKMLDGARELQAEL